MLSLVFYQTSRGPQIEFFSSFFEHSPLLWWEHLYLGNLLDLNSWTSSQIYWLRYSGGGTLQTFLKACQVILIHAKLFRNHCYRYGVPITNTWEKKSFTKIQNIKIKMKNILTNNKPHQKQIMWYKEQSEDGQRRKGNVREGGQFYGDKWKVHFWWWGHWRVCRGRNIMWYAWNVYNVISQHYLNKNVSKIFHFLSF